MAAEVARLLDRLGRKVERSAASRLHENSSGEAAGSLIGRVLYPSLRPATLWPEGPTILSPASGVRFFHAGGC